MANQKAKINMRAIPRVPLKIRTVNRSDGEPSNNGSPEFRPITQLIGTSSVGTRKQRSVSSWAAKNRANNVFVNGTFPSLTPRKASRRSF